MNKWIRVFVLILLCGMLVVLCGGLALGMYYRKNFPVNTWINGVYCTGKTIEEVNAELVEQTVLPQITIVDGEGEEWFLEADSVETGLQESAETLSETKCYRNVDGKPLHSCRSGIDRHPVQLG